MSTRPLLKAVEDTRDAPIPATNADKARALIAMLERGSEAPAGVPPDRLRDWARDLIQTVEGGAPAEPPAPPPTVRRRRLFAADAPKLAPAPAAPAPPPPASASAAPAPTGRLTLTAPMPHSPEAPAQATRPAVPSTFSTVEVRKVVDSTIDPASLGREHPAIIAMTLLGKPTLEQARALRSLAGGQVRAVHRALRQLEEAAPPPPSAEPTVPRLA